MDRKLGLRLIMRRNFRLNGKRGSLNVLNLRIILSLLTVLSLLNLRSLLSHLNFRGLLSLLSFLNFRGLLSLQEFFRNGRGTDFFQRD